MLLIRPLLRIKLSGVFSWELLSAAEDSFPILLLSLFTFSLVVSFPPFFSLNHFFPFNLYSVLILTLLNKQSTHFAVLY